MNEKFSLHPWSRGKKKVEGGNPEVPEEVSAISYAEEEVQGAGGEGIVISPEDIAALRAAVEAAMKKASAEPQQEQDEQERLRKAVEKYRQLRSKRNITAARAQRKLDRVKRAPPLSPFTPEDSEDSEDSSVSFDLVRYLVSKGFASPLVMEKFPLEDVLKKAGCSHPAVKYHYLVTSLISFLRRYKTS